MKSTGRSGPIRKTVVMWLLPQSQVR